MIEKLFNLVIAIMMKLMNVIRKNDYGRLEAIEDEVNQIQCPSVSDIADFLEQSFNQSRM